MGPMSLRRASFSAARFQAIKRQWVPFRSGLRAHSQHRERPIRT